MTNLLLRLFVKNYKNTEDPSVRTAYGSMAGATGIVCNIFLFASKLIIGLLSGSISITADAINNLSDAGSSIVTLVGFRLSSKPADDEHPYGHARIEYITALIVAGLILLIGFELGKSSLDKIIHPEPVQFSPALVIVLLLSIAVKFWMAAFNRALGKRINSTALSATAADSRNDVIATGTVLISCLISHFFHVDLDGYVGILVALFIFYSGICVAKDTIEPLMGMAPDAEMVGLISTEITKHPEVFGIHDLMVHDYGPGKRFATVHAEFDSQLDPMVVHELLDNIERDMLEEHRIQLTIHYDPLVTDDDEANSLRDKINMLVQSIDPELSIHDFRMVRGAEHSNLIFDVALPYRLEGRKAEIQRTIDAALKFDGMRYYTNKQG